MLLGFCVFSIYGEFYSVSNTYKSRHVEFRRPPKWSGSENRSHEILNANVNLDLLFSPFRLTQNSQQLATNEIENNSSNIIEISFIVRTSYIYIGVQSIECYQNTYSRFISVSSLLCAHFSRLFFSHSISFPVISTYIQGKSMYCLLKHKRIKWK